jgi:hypothetical protein
MLQELEGLGGCVFELENLRRVPTERRQKILILDVDAMLT